ncbi:hypothetical protein EJ05DRAFT_484756 [Pseudovirgaria hyperparasitica]|uniref:AAA+ ATPase domain-containing protein n=1 Tax=Pseudovirgaria hyperparasitica TaxID=470096 RepID=A0A6A6WE56_9PEZI|nr:uncharacterized protein EJ05DRAFT_484756 [Pseudovirgaria hyperparasitica]KAF2759857.1 hypothetical protein EJ05DRAFT_484756 [Pseudovirgaria hyperparasitica]
MSLEKPVIIGIYGLPGAGKSYLMRQLKEKLSETDFLFFEGSEVIATLTPGGLDAFKRLSQEDQTKYRHAAGISIKEQCKSLKAVGVVTGHFMFWSGGEEEANEVWTAADAETFSHIIYLDEITSVISTRRQNDTVRDRENVCLDHIHRWKETEEDRLRKLCGTHGIIFTRAFPYPDMLQRVVPLIQDFATHTEARNLEKASAKLDMALSESDGKLDTLVVIDGDKTLAPQDAGQMFWDRYCIQKLSWKEAWTPTSVHSGPLGYSYEAFRQVALLHDEALGQKDFDDLCDSIAKDVDCHPEFVSLLKEISNSTHTRAVVLTCGLSRVWETVLKKLELGAKVNVIGGGRLSHDLVITPEVKRSLVLHAQKQRGLFVVAFGDSPLDIPMLCQADKAVIIVGDEKTRSRSMDTNLTSILENDEYRLNAVQIPLPPEVVPRLDVNKLPVINFDNLELNRAIFHSGTGLKLHHATSNAAAKVLATSMRDASVGGPELRERHRRAGFYLAAQFVSKIVGLEECEIRHVLGHQDHGYCLLHERKTLIVPLMRGGEPMAFGVNDVFPKASFVHAKNPPDITELHLQDCSTVILVDSVINTGKSLVEFVTHVRGINTKVRIVVVAGVIQADAIAKSSLLAELPKDFRLEVIGLRLSKTKFTGQGTTDTGNRLFNTTHLD